jgi:hypothetical protein
MCDKLIKAELTKEEIPQYVYKRVQKVDNGKYATPVMGEPLYKGSWKGAKKYERYGCSALIKYLKTKFRKDFWPTSSPWTRHHVGRWAAFKTFNDAKNADLVSNFLTDNGYKFPTIVVKCEIRGDVSAGSFEGCDTYLASQIRVVEELTK